MSGLRHTLSWAAALALLFMMVEFLGAQLSGHYSLYQVVFMRYGVHLIIVIAVLGKRRLTLPFRTAQLPRQIMRSLLMLAMPACWIAAFHAGADTMALAAGLGTTPILVAFLTRYWLGWPVGSQSWGAAALSSLGSAVLGWHHLHWSAASLFAVGAGFSFAFYIVQTAQLSEESLSVNLFHTAFWVFLALTPVQPMVWSPPLLRDLPVIIAIGGFGLLGLLALDHMTRGEGFVAATSLVNLQLLLPVALGLAHTHAAPSQNVIAVLLLASSMGMVLAEASRRPTLVRCS